MSHVIRFWNSIKVVHREYVRGFPSLLICTAILGFCVIFNGSSFAEPSLTGSDGSNNYGFMTHSWTTKQGLPENTVTALLQTRDGYLWVGTPDGLACFDGVQFRRYGLRDGLPHLGITALEEDRRGVLWIGTENGLARCDGRRNPLPVFKAALRGFYIRGMAEDAEGRQWIGTDKGLYQCTAGRLIQCDTQIGLPAQSISFLYVDHSGAVWVWGSATRLFKIVNGKAEEVPVDYPYPRARTIHCLFEDRSGRLWASMGNGYLLCRQNGTWKRFTEAEGIPFYYLSSLAETRDGTLWAASFGRGLFYLSGDHFVPLQNTSGSSAEFIQTLVADSEGTLWAGSAASGLLSLQPKQLVTLATESGLTNNVVQSITQMPDGNLMAATEEGLYQEDHGRFKRLLTHTKADIYRFTRSVLATHDSNLWWAADWNLNNLKTVSLPMFTNVDLPPQTMSNIIVTCLYEDRHQRLWLGTFTGLWRQKAGGFKRASILPPSIRVPVITELTDGALAVGTAKSGLFLLCSNGVQHYTTQQGLGSDSIRALYCDSAGVLWIGTRSGGLNRLKNGIIFDCTTHEGLINDTISQILEDDEGNLWLGSNQGISRVSKHEFEELAAGKITLIHPLNLGIEDGMLTEECAGGTTPNALKSRAGRLYFSTLKGIVVVDPKRYWNRSGPPSVVIESLLINGRFAPQPKTPAFSNADTDQSQTPGEIRLPPGDNNLEIRYTGLHSIAPDAIIFRYKLEALDHTWTEAGTRRFANYDHVPPGHYRFRVMAANRDGTWTDSTASLAFYLKPYFYQTWWFGSCFLLICAVILALIVRYIVRRRLQRHLQLLELERSLESERRRIARDLHDELGARLTGIAHLGELAMRNDHPPQATKAQIGFITSRVWQLMGAMDEVVWTINPKNDSVPNIVSFLSDYTEQFLTPTGISWRLDLDPEFPNLSVPAQSRHNLLLACKETLNNAVRHGAPTLIRMKIHLKQDRLEITISDNGRGFDPAQARAGGHGLANIKNRMELAKGQATIHSEPGSGTTVKLSLPLGEVRN